jgi:fucose permease
MNQPIDKALRPGIFSVYAAGVVQGVALVTFPAAGGILTSPHHYALSNTEYGILFIPQALMAILSSLVGPGITRRMGGKRIFQLGLLFNLISMLLLLGSQFLMNRKDVAFPMLMVATTCMGMAFGFTVPTINTYASQYFPMMVDRAILALNTLLGLGTALAPAIVSLFVGMGIWWGLPLGVALLTTGLILFTLPLSLRLTGAEGIVSTGTKPPSPPLFWLFAAVALVYGICETMNGNWSAIFMSSALGASPIQASLALTCFWGMVTVGRLFFATSDRWIPGKVTFRVLPLVIGISFLMTSSLGAHDSFGGIFSFALAGFGCSAMLPLIISFAQNRMPEIATSVAGGMIAFYQIGYGIAAFGVGSMEKKLAMPLSRIFGASIFFAAILIFLTLLVGKSGGSGKKVS